MRPQGAGPGRWRHRWRHSLRVRLIIVFVLLALAMTAVFLGGMQRAFSTGWRDAARPLVTDYVNKKTARALVFRIDRPDEYLVLDKTNLAARIPDERRIQLERNDHAFLEVSRIEGSMLTLRVWGYGAPDPRGFRFQCAYELDQGTTTCRDMVAAGAKP